MISLILTSRWWIHESLNVCLCFWCSGSRWKKRTARWEGRRGALLLVSPGLYTSRHSDTLLKLCVCVRVCVCVCVRVFLQGAPGEPGAPGLSGSPGASGPQVSDQSRTQNHSVISSLDSLHRIHVFPAGSQRGQRSTRTERNPWTPWTSGQYVTFTFLMQHLLWALSSWQRTHEPGSPLVVTSGLFSGKIMFFWMNKYLLCLFWTSWLTTWFRG